VRTARGRPYHHSRRPGPRSSRSRSQRSAAGLCWTALHAQRGHLEIVTQVRSEEAEKVDLSGLEVRGSRLADQVHGALEISAGGEGAAHLVGEPERTKILRVAGGELQIAARGFGEKTTGWWVSAIRRTLW
jgi:hypothetical protein